VNIQGEFYGIHGPLGVPLIIGNQGVEQIVEIKLTKEEKTALVQNAQNINKKLEKFLE
jgi:malate dehydrogenase